MDGDVVGTVGFLDGMDTVGRMHETVQSYLGVKGRRRRSRREIVVWAVEGGNSRHLFKRRGSLKSSLGSSST